MGKPVFKLKCLDTKSCDHSLYECCLSAVVITLKVSAKVNKPQRHYFALEFECLSS